VPNEIRQYISKERQGRAIGKEYIKPWLDEFCEGNGFKKISVSTIGRIIKQLKAKGEILSRKELSFNAKSGKIGELKKTNLYKERRKDRPSKKPGDIVQIDSVHLSENGIKRYFITAIDICGRETFAKEYKTLNSANAKDFFVDLEKQYPFNIRRVQTDNGLEFYKHFDQYLKRLGITHFWNYPRTPKSNSYIERFNRTFREQFLNTYQGDLTDVQNVQKDLNDYLFWYNHKKVHQGLNYQTPFVFTQQFLHNAS
jgi:transposase InsO family protein